MAPTMSAMQDEYEDETLTIGVAVDKHSNSRTRGRRNDERWKSQWELGMGLKRKKRGVLIPLRVQGRWDQQRTLHIRFTSSSRVSRFVAILSYFHSLYVIIPQ